MAIAVMAREDRSVRPAHEEQDLSESEAVAREAGDRKARKEQGRPR